MMNGTIKLIETLSCKANWMLWSVPPCTACCLIYVAARRKTTCLLPLAQFFMDAKLKQIRVNNKKGRHWWKNGARKPKRPRKVGALNVTYTANEEFLYLGTTVKIQRKLRKANINQCRELYLPLPVFQGAVEDCPTWRPSKRQ